jgi:hypothetical protein
LKSEKRVQTNDLLKIQTQEYIGFVKNFTETTNIMTKSFFVVVPYSPAILQKGGGLSMLAEKMKARNKRKMTNCLKKIGLSLKSGWR